MTPTETEARECLRLCREALGMPVVEYGPGTELNGLHYLLEKRRASIGGQLVARSQQALAAFKQERGK